MHWTGYASLAMAVLELAVREAHAGSADARSFLEHDGPMLHHWCSLLGLQPKTLHRVVADPRWPERYAKARAVLANEHLNRSAPPPAHSDMVAPP